MVWAPYSFLWGCSTHALEKAACQMGRRPLPVLRPSARKRSGWACVNASAQDLISVLTPQPTAAGSPAPGHRAGKMDLPENSGFPEAEGREKPGDKIMFQSPMLSCGSGRKGDSACINAGGRVPPPALPNDLRPAAAGSPAPGHRAGKMDLPENSGFPEAEGWEGP